MPSPVGWAADRGLEVEEDSPPAVCRQPQAKPSRAIHVGTGPARSVLRRVGRAAMARGTIRSDRPVIDDSAAAGKRGPGWIEVPEAMQRFHGSNFVL